MEIRVFDNATQVGAAGAALFAAQLLKKPDSVLGLATGSSPIPTYQHLIELYKAGAVDFSHAVSYNLDEYVGLNPDHPCSYHYFMMDQLFNHVNMRSEAIHVPCGNAADLDAGAKAYDAAIEQAGDIDMQLLGIGRNGHIGFNEPDSCFACGTHQVTLTESTIAANTRFFENEAQVPRQAYSMGMQAIMQAKRVLLIASGADKAEAIRNSFFGPVTPQVPASILQFHRDVIVIADEAALADCPAEA